MTKEIEYRWTDQTLYKDTGWHSRNEYPMGDYEFLIQIAEGRIEIRIKPKPPEENRFLKAFKEGKRVQFRQHGCKEWIDASSDTVPIQSIGHVILRDWRILTIREVPLTYDDVMPGTPIMHNGGGSKDSIGAVFPAGIKLWMGQFISWDALMSYQRWNGTEWAPCSKLIEDVEE